VVAAIQDSGLTIDYKEINHMDRYKKLGRIWKSILKYMRGPSGFTITTLQGYECGRACVLQAVTADTRFSIPSCQINPPVLSPYLGRGTQRSACVGHIPQASLHKLRPRASEVLPNNRNPMSQKRKFEQRVLNTVDVFAEPMKEARRETSFIVVPHPEIPHRPGV
jgi:hypothetical protein